MKEKLLLLLRVSKPKYNSTLYKDYKLYIPESVISGTQESDCEAGEEVIP